MTNSQWLEHKEQLRAMLYRAKNMYRRGGLTDRQRSKLLNIVSVRQARLVNWYLTRRSL